MPMTFPSGSQIRERKSLIGSRRAERLLRCWAWAPCTAWQLETHTIWPLDSPQPQCRWRSTNKHKGGLCHWVPEFGYIQCSVMELSLIQRIHSVTTGYWYLFPKYVLSPRLKKRALQVKSTHHVEEPPCVLQTQGNCQATMGVLIFDRGSFINVGFIPRKQFEPKKNNIHISICLYRYCEVWNQNAS